MATSTSTSTGICYDRAGPPGQLPVLLLHAGVADRRMWDPIWPGLTRERDAVRLDLRGSGESSARPTGELDPVTDVLDTLGELGIGACHLVGASYGAGVAVELALTSPARARSLLLVAPGGSLIAERTADLAEFIQAERAALAADDLAGAVEANLAWWLDGPSRTPAEVDPAVRTLVARMQRRAFEVTADWDEVAERELDPPALQRLGELDLPVLTLVGGLDLLAIKDAGRRLSDGITGARQLDWPDTAHLPSMERPAEFLALLLDWLAGQPAR